MSLPEAHQSFVDQAVRAIEADDRLIGVAAAGSWLRAEMDEWSDVDLVILVDEPHFEIVLAERGSIAASMGDLVSWFTGEHVGETRLIICMFGPPLLHVDLKFVTPAQLAAERVEDPAILWERDGAMSSSLSSGEAKWPRPDWQWIEDRIWTWIHYVSCKLGRGELLEVVSGLDFLRTQVLAGTAVTAAGHPAQGVRRFEVRCPELMDQMVATIPRYDAASCATSIRAAVAMYRHLRDECAPADLTRRETAEREAVAFLETTIAGVVDG